MPSRRLVRFLALIAISGFAIGRAVANARKWIHQAPAVSDSKVVRTDGWLQGSLTVFLVMAAICSDTRPMLFAQASATSPRLPSTSGARRV